MDKQNAGLAAAERNVGLDPQAITELTELALATVGGGIGDIVGA
jgi:hypothetical protein